MSVLDNANYIIKASYHPCAKPDPILLMQAAYEAAKPTLLSAVSFGCLDIIKMRAGISPWHSRGMKALIGGAKLPDDPYNHKKLLKYTIPVEKALFFWFVVDLTTDFQANFASQIFKLEACGEHFQGKTGSGPLATWVEPVGDAYVPVSYFFIVNGSGPGAITGSGFTVPKDWYFSAYFSLNTKPIFHDLFPGSAQLRLHRFGPSVYDYEGEVAKPPWFNNQISSHVFVEPDDPVGEFAEYRFEAKADKPCLAESGSAVVTISPNPIRNRGIVPVNCFGQPVPGASGIG